MSYRIDKIVIDTQMVTQTDTGNNKTRRPKLASGKNRKKSEPEKIFNV